MRKLLVAIAAALLLVPATISTASPQLPDALLFRFAFTSFLRHPQHGPPSLYFGGGVENDVTFRAAFAGRGPCHREERRGRKFWACRASARGIDVLPTGFYMDPYLQTAHVELEHRGFAHTIDFTGKGEPGGSYGGNLNGGVVFLWNQATAEGRLFGHRFSTKRDRAVGHLLEVAFVDFASDGVRVRMGDDGRIHMTALIPADRTR